jgi:2-isopropylmalate synthase
VHRIEAGFPVTSPDDAERVRTIAHAGLKSEIWGFGRALAGDVKVNADCGVKAMVLEISISDSKIAAYGLTREKVLSRVQESMSLAKSMGLKVAFMPVDLTRADMRFAETVITTAVKEGANEVVLVDTIGVASPETVTYLAGRMRSWVDVPLMSMSIAISASASPIRSLPSRQAPTAPMSASTASASAPAMSTSPKWPSRSNSSTASRWASS